MEEFDNFSNKFSDNISELPVMRMGNLDTIHKNTEKQVVTMLNNIFEPIEQNKENDLNEPTTSNNSDKNRLIKYSVIATLLFFILNISVLNKYLYKFSRVKSNHIRLMIKTLIFFGILYVTLRYVV